jgi:hypothetical protein
VAVAAPAITRRRPHMRESVLIILTFYEIVGSSLAQACRFISAQ